MTFLYPRPDIRKNDETKVSDYNDKFGLDENNLPFHLTRPLSDMGMNGRLSNQMKSAGIIILNDVRYFSRKDFLKFRHFGDSTLHQLEDIVIKNGGWFLEDHEDPDLVQDQLLVGKEIKPDSSEDDIIPVPYGAFDPTYRFIENAKFASKDRSSLQIAVPRNIKDITKIVEKLRQAGRTVDVTLTIK